MNKILTICITYHGEPKNKIIPLLQTLDSQIGNVFDKVKFILSNNSNVPTDYQLESKLKKFYKNKFATKDLLAYSDITGRISNISNVGYNISFQDWANNILED